MVNKIQEWLVVVLLLTLTAMAIVFLAIVVKEEFTDCTPVKKVECVAPKCVVT